MFVIGYVKDDGELDVDWCAFVVLGYMLVVYMGVSRVVVIVACLIEGGRVALMLVVEFGQCVLDDSFLIGCVFFDDGDWC
jgi:Uroporphyrinogen-III methylase